MMEITFCTSVSCLLRKVWSRFLRRLQIKYETIIRSCPYDNTRLVGWHYIAADNTNCKNQRKFGKETVLKRKKILLVHIFLKCFNFRCHYSFSRGQKTSEWTDVCHPVLRSYPLLIAEMLFGTHFYVEIWRKTTHFKLYFANFSPQPTHVWRLFLTTVISYLFS